MANINRQITLTTKGSNSGPLYDIYYSEDCINYTICIDGSSVSLPNIGSTAIITLPDTATCIKLVNLSVGCLLNEVIQYLVCECYETITLNVTASGTITYLNCFGTPQSESVSPGLVTIGTFGTGCVNATTLGGTAIYSLDAFGICCVPTSTTTTTTIAPTTTTTTLGTTTTTTLAPTTTTTTFSPDPCNCVEVNITSAGGEVATFNCYGQNENYVYMTAGTRYLCAAVIGGLLQAEIVSGTGTITPVGNCKTSPCPAPTTTSTTTLAPTTTTTIAPTTTTTTSTTSTTTTTTAAPTTTTTTIPCNCVQFVNIEVTGAGNVTYLDCNDVLQTQGVGIGPEVIGGLPNCVQRNTLGGTATFTIDSYGPCCTTTTTTTTTAAPTTTTTTTIAPTTTTTTTGAPVEYQIDNGASGDSASACSGATTTSIVYASPGNTYHL